MIDGGRHVLLRVLVFGLTLLLCGGAASKSFAAEAPPYVAGAARLPATSAEAGEVLLSELSCLACHGEESKLPPSLVTILPSCEKAIAVFRSHSLAGFPRVPTNLEVALSHSLNNPPVPVANSFPSGE